MLFESCAGFYTTLLTAQKLCAATLNWRGRVITVLSLVTKVIALVKSSCQGWLWCHHFIKNLIAYFLALKLSSYVIIIKKGYQDTEKPYSSVTTKVKGTALTNLTSTSGQSFPLYGGVHLWDSPDYIVPPEVSVWPFNLPDPYWTLKSKNAH